MYGEKKEKKTRSQIELTKNKKKKNEKQINKKIRVKTIEPP